MERKKWFKSLVEIHKNDYVNIAYPSQWKFIRDEMPFVWVGANKVVVNEDFGGKDFLSRRIHRRRVIYRRAVIE